MSTSSKLTDTITNSEHYQKAVDSLGTLSLGNQASVVAICNAARYGWSAACASPGFAAMQATDKFKLLGAIAKDLKSRLPEDCRSYRQYFTVNAIAMGCALATRFDTNPDAKYPRSPDVLRAAIPLFALVGDTYPGISISYIGDIVASGQNSQQILDDAAALTYDAFKAKYGPDVWGPVDEVTETIADRPTTWRAPTSRPSGSTSTNGLATSVPVAANYQFDNVTDIVAWVLNNIDKLSDDEKSALSSVINP